MRRYIFMSAFVQADRGTCRVRNGLCLKRVSSKCLQEDNMTGITYGAQQWYTYHLMGSIFLARRKPNDNTTSTVVMNVQDDRHDRFHAGNIYSSNQSMLFWPLLWLQPCRSKRCIGFSFILLQCHSKLLLWTRHAAVAVLFHSTVPRCYPHRISDRVTVILTDNSHDFLQSLQEIARIVSSRTP
jgi:hypothetical protein